MAGHSDIWNLPDSIRRKIQDELSESEKIAWLGQPIPTQVPGSSTATAWLGGFVMAFAIAWGSLAVGFRIPDFTEARDFFALLCLPFVLIGLALLTSPYFAIRQARRTVYLVTSRRAIIVKGDREKVHSFFPKDLANVRRNQQTEEFGDLLFKPSAEDEPTENVLRPGFYAISNARQVERLIGALIRNLN